MIAGGIFKLVKIPVVFIATQMGKDHLLRQPFVRQTSTSSTSQIEELALVVGQNLSYFNKGMMS